jgi:hypothetical protein
MDRYDSVLEGNIMKKIIAVEYIKQCIDYDADTGLFVWKERPREHFKTERGHKQTNARQVGKPAFAVPHSAGYLHGALDGVRMFAHRVAWAIHYGHWPEDEIDHINHVKTDNRIDNLRATNRLDNGKNLSRKSNNKSGVNGVHVHSKTKRFIAQIRVNRRVIHLGSFVSLQEAAAARRKAEEQHGFHKNHGI